MRRIATSGVLPARESWYDEPRQFVRLAEREHPMDRALPSADPPILQARHISKSFAGVHALADVSLTVRGGEVHALVGENGAGKSTLMNVLAGLHQPDAGEILLQGRRVPIRTPHEAMRLGIAMIHQELMPVPDLTVAENHPAWPRAGLTGDRLDPIAAPCVREARRCLDLLGIELPLNRRMRDLSVAQTQTVEIARAIGRDSRIVIMDEPTAAISDCEVNALFRVIGTLTRCGVAIVYSTHKMEEVFRIARTDHGAARRGPGRDLCGRRARSAPTHRADGRPRDPLHVPGFLGHFGRTRTDGAESQPGERVP